MKSIDKTAEIPTGWHDLRKSVPKFGSRVEYLCEYQWRFVWSAVISDTGEIIYDDLFGSDQEDILMRTGFIAWKYFENVNP